MFNHKNLVKLFSRTAQHAYFTATLLMATVLCIRLATAPVSTGLAFESLVPALILACVLGGYRAGLVSIFLGICFSIFIFSPPYYSVSLEAIQHGFWPAVGVLFDGLVVLFAVEALRRYRVDTGHSTTGKEATWAEVTRHAVLRTADAAFETHDAILVTDTQPAIIRVNKSFEQMTGYTAEEVLGHNPSILSSGRHDKVFYEAMWAEITRKGSWSGELWDRRKNGQIYPKWATLTEVKDAEGNPSGYVGIFHDLTERKQSEAEIHALAFYDVLTNLPNRRLLMDRLRLALAVSERSRSYGALLSLDMDKFKVLNDTLGHAAGDIFLVEVANRLRYSVREVDTIARLGGDEFAVLVEHTGEDQESASQRVAEISERIRSALAVPYRITELDYPGSPSIGVCVFHGNQTKLDDLVKYADMAMYQAKEAGRNTIRFYDPVMQKATEARSVLQTDLSKALLEKQFKLYYQVQVDKAHRPFGAEALIRWVHPSRGMVSPAEFIPLAEESSLIVDIGRWVLETAGQQLAAWQTSERTRNLVLAVNVSARQFMRKDFVESVATVLQENQLNPALLKLELTESVVLSDVADVVNKMNELNALGVSLSLDDFGTGYSSLAYLKRLPFDQLKIDQSFVRDITTDNNDAVMVKTIIEMANNYRLNVIAEGVETEEQLEFLKSQGCISFQGYLFGKPLPVEQFEALLW